MDEKQMVLNAVERFVRMGGATDGEIAVTRLQDDRTSCVEQVEGEGRSVMLDEFTVDGKVVWAGYSSRSQTVYISSVNS
jgi:hypothetical protein